MMGARPLRMNPRSAVSPVYVRMIFKAFRLYNQAFPSHILNDDKVHAL